jgi:hypothetical protein
MPARRSEPRQQVPELRAASFDYLIGAGKYRLRNDEAEGLGSVKVDHQLEFGRLMDRQIGWLGAVEDLW